MRQEKLFNRPILLIGEEAQNKILHLKVAVAGCGILGTPLIAIMTRMGIAELRVLDIDIVKLVNLTNNLFLTRTNVGTKKADAAAEVAQSLSLRKLKVIPYSFDVTDVHQWNNLKHFVAGADLVYGCFDNIPARESLNAAAIVEDVKYVDLGIEGYSGRIRLIDRNRACYACNPLVPEHRSINIYSLGRTREGCDYAPTATILPTALLTAAHAVMEGLKFLNILKSQGLYDYVYYDFLTLSNPVKMQITKQKNCVICGFDGMVSWNES